MVKGKECYLKLNPKDYEKDYDVDYFYYSYFYFKSSNGIKYRKYCNLEL